MTYVSLLSYQPNPISMKNLYLNLKTLVLGVFVMTFLAMLTLSACGGGTSEKTETKTDAVEEKAEETSEHPGSEHPSATTEEEMESDSSAMDQLDHPSGGEEHPSSDETDGTEEEEEV
jgi:hypothetical protein